MLEERFISPRGLGYYPPAKEQDTTCGAHHPLPADYQCTREYGHRPPHAAHDTNDNQVATWDDYNVN